MTRKEYEEAKRYLSEISHRLNNEDLTTDERQQLLVIKSQLSGALLSPWLPFGWGRRTIMLGLFLIGGYGVFAGHAYSLLAWVAILLFSPHAMGLLAYGVGRFMAGFGGK